MSSQHKNRKKRSWRMYSYSLQRCKVRTYPRLEETVHRQHSFWRLGRVKKRVDCMCFVTDCTLEVRCFASFVCNSLTPVTLSAAEQQLGLVLAPGLTVNSTLQATDHSNTLPWSHMWHAACALGSGRSCCSLSHTPVIFYLVLLKPDVIN